MTDKQLDGLYELYELDDRIEQLCSQYQDNNAEISTLESLFVLSCHRFGLNCIEVSRHADERRKLAQSMRAVNEVSKQHNRTAMTYGICRK